MRDLRDVEVGPETSGGTVSAHLGDRIVVRLDDNPTTGYRWFADEADGPDETILTYDGSAFEPPDPVVPGRPGRRTFRYLATSPGQCQLRLVSRRPGGEPAATFSVTIAVADG